MKAMRLLAISIAGLLVSAGHLSAQDLSRYREFQVGIGLPAVAAQAGISSEEAHVLQLRPALIQELTWQPTRVQLSSDRDPVSTIRFSFYNGQLFRMVVTYDRDRIEGLTAADLIEAISATYGQPTLPATLLMNPTSLAPGDRAIAPRSQLVASARRLDFGDKFLAHWEDAENSIHLFQSAYQSGFGLTVVSKPLDALARSATADAARLDAQEAPQREIERQQKQKEDHRLRTETARRANKQTFRP
jgi:hypothetical protein